MVRDRLRLRRLGVPAVLLAALCAGTTDAADSAPDPRTQLLATGGAWPVRGSLVASCLSRPSTNGTTLTMCGDGPIVLSGRPAPVRARAIVHLRFGAPPSDVFVRFQRDERPRDSDLVPHAKATADPRRFTIRLPRSLPCGLQVLTVGVYYGRVGHVTQGDAFWSLPLRTRTCAPSFRRGARPTPSRRPRGSAAPGRR